MIALRLIYLLNIIVAGQIAYTSILHSDRAALTIFANAYPATDVIRLVGCLWLGITVLSILGMWRPMTFTPVLLLQLVYKGTWLIVVVLPALRSGEAFPRGMAGFFLVWVIILPFLIPWSTWLGNTQ